MNDAVISALLGSFQLVVPEMILGVTACVLFLGATFRADRHLWGAVALISLVLAGVALFLGPRSPTAPVPDAEAVIFASPLLVDRVAVLLEAVALVAGVILVLCSWDEVPDAQAAEYHGCLLIIVAGLALVAAANELITLFLALELISIPTYVLLYLPRLNNPSQEAAMKYFLLSIFASALLLFGFSYLYGMVGTTNLPALADAMAQARVVGLPAVSLIPECSHSLRPSSAASAISWLSTVVTNTRSPLRLGAARTGAVIGVRHRILPSAASSARTSA